jgi:DNA-binding NarL/FixJ family response regulator
MSAAVGVPFRSFMSHPKDPQKLTDELTTRGRQIVSLACSGKPNEIIAYELDLTEGTVKEYMHRIFRKVGVKNRNRACNFGVGEQGGFVNVPLLRDVSLA